VARAKRAHESDPVPRSYRLPNGDRLLEERWESVTGFSLDPGGVLRLSDGTFVEPRCFTLFDAKNERKRHFGPPGTNALDDYLYLLDVYYVNGGCLRTAMIEIGGPSQSCSVRLSMEKIVLERVEFPLFLNAKSFDDRNASQADLADLVRSAIEVVDELSGKEDELSALTTAEWIKLLAKVANRSDAALRRLVMALQDDRAYDEGAGNPYASYVQKVSDHVIGAFYPNEIRPRALPFLLSGIHRLDACGRTNAARVLRFFGTRDTSALAALELLAADSDEGVRRAANLELTSIRRERD
jgi:hypothetical protein